MSDRSRIVVFSLPSALSREELRAYFSTLNLPITDVKLLANKAGNSRRVGFIGFRNNADAQQAKDWYDGTWLAGSRIKVAFAEVGNPPLASRKLEHAPSFGVPDDLDRSEEIGTVSSAPATSDLSRPKRSASVDDDSDSAYLAKRMRRQPGALPPVSVQDTEHEVELPSSSQRSSKSPDQARSPASANSSAVQTGRLFLRNLAFTVTRQEILDAFCCFGEIQEVHVPSQQGRNKGIAFVQFTNSQHAEVARQAMDRKFLAGRLLHIIPSSSRLGGSALNSERLESRQSDTFIQRKRSRLVMQADQSFNWASLYIGSDAVVTSLAARHETSKAEILDATDSSVAARLALAESYIIQETKDYFSTNGVDVEALQNPGSRSRTTLFIKNLPAGSSAATVRSLLQSSEAITRLLVPPSGVIALVEFSTPLAASQAIKSLAYRKVGNSLIYTEHAPTDLWKTDSPAIDHKAMKLAETSARGRLRSGKASDEPEMSNSLYVTGLPPQTNAATFKSLFQGLTGFSHARLHAQPLYGERGRGSMSGFVGFSTPDDAQQARQVLHGHVLDGHIISVVKARSRTINTGSAEAPGSAKMVIKNLPFEADRHELKRLLSAYGTIRSLRMPVNAQSRTRGFAFVQFDTPQEAAAARSGLSFTHLLGRHLIIEEAQ